MGRYGPKTLKPNSTVAIPPPAIAKWAHVIARIEYPRHFTPRIVDWPIWGWLSVSGRTLMGVLTVCHDGRAWGPYIRMLVGVAPAHLATPTIAKWAHVVYSEQFFKP